MPHPRLRPPRRRHSRNSQTPEPSADPGTPETRLERRVFDLHVFSTEVNRAERDFMQKLRPMLRRSPRSLTRYVNIFRLLKAIEGHFRAADSSGTSLDQEVDEITMYVLAVLTGCPAAAQELLTEIAVLRADHDQSVELMTVVQRDREGVHQTLGESKNARQAPTSGISWGGG